MFETGRLGIHLLNAFFDIADYLPWIYLFLCLFFICVGNAILMSFWKKYINGYDEWVGILFCIMVISYPGFAYKFIFTVNLVQMGIVYLCVIGLVCINYLLIIEKIKSYPMLCVNVILLLYYIIFINYETAVAFVVILFVFSVVFSNIRFDARTWLKKGCAFFGLILVSAFVWKVVEKIIFKSVRIIPDKYASAYIQYSRGHIISQIITMIKQFGEYLYANNVQLLIYIVLLIALIAFILKNNNTLFIKMLWVLIEIGSLSFMQIECRGRLINCLERACISLFFGQLQLLHCICK